MNNYTQQPDNYGGHPPNGYPLDNSFDGDFPSPSMGIGDASFFDKHFERQFKSAIAVLRKTNSQVFNLSLLKLEPLPMGSTFLFFVDVRGVSDNSFFKRLESLTCFVTSKKELTGQFAYAFSNKKQSISPPQGFRAVATPTVVPVPNSHNWKDPDERIIYAGVERDEGGASLQYFYISETLLYRKPTYVVTISLKRVSNHLGGRVLTLTNGSDLYLVVQDRSKMRNTETKNIYHISKDISECYSYIRQVHDFLVNTGKAFTYQFFDVVNEVDGLSTQYNLTYKELPPTMDIEESFVELPLSDE